jgi:dephospho-CoA kinase
MPYCVAVSGGIASGKSSICSLLENAGATLIDADVIARELVLPNEPATQEIALQLGSQYILEDGNLDRVALRTHVFSNAKAKLTLEKILHPRIQDALFVQSQQATSPYVIVAIPLLTPEIRKTTYAWLNRVLIVEAPEQIQMARIMARDNCSEELARAMIAAQLNFSERLPMADDVIINDGSFNYLQQWTERLHKHYFNLAV